MSSSLSCLVVVVVFVPSVESIRVFLHLYIVRVGRSEKANGKAKIGVGAEINIELLGGTDRVVVTDPDPNRFGFG